MIIKNPPKLSNRNSFLTYIEVDLWSWLKQLANGLLKINFQQNFQSFIVKDIVIPPNEEVAIPNQFFEVYPGTLPDYRIIVRQRGDATIIDGPTSWNPKLVYLFNTSMTNSATITVIFFK
jgi:hypothetical protein